MRKFEAFQDFRFIALDLSAATAFELEHLGSESVGKLVRFLGIVDVKVVEGHRGDDGAGEGGAAAAL